jgi:hypothetical protein
VTKSPTADTLAERLLQVIDEGRRTATYKLALLLALIDACAATTDEHGAAPRTLHTRAVAFHVLRLYYPQVRLYLGATGEELALRQITVNESPVLAAVLRLRMAAEAHRCRSLQEACERLPSEYERCLDQVEHTFARYPILRLQTLGSTSRPFLYDVDWSESVSLAALHRSGGGVLRLREGAGDRLLQLAPLLRPLVELHWTRMVASINDLDIEGHRLHAHLFGAERVAFPPSLRAGLFDLQGGRCFYCTEPLPARTEIDHFLPWSRWPNDAIENLVLADRCNGYKGHHVPALRHVDTWASRLGDSHDRLRLIAQGCGWETDAWRSLSLARSSYAHLPPGTPLWLGDGMFGDDDLATVTARLGDVAAHLPQVGSHEGVE